MATVVGRLEAILSANTEHFERGMDRSETRMHKVGHAAGIAGGIIAAGLAVGLERSFHAAVEAEVSQARLTTAFTRAHLNASLYRKRVEELESSSRKLGFTDDDVRTSLGSLITATGSYQKSAKDLGVAEDIARFKHVQLSDASKMLTMAMTGSQRAAKQLGITVIPVTTAEDALKRTHADLTTVAGKAELAHAKLIDKMRTGDATIRAVEAHVHGQAAAYSQTAAGGMAQFHAQLGHLEESMGRFLLPIVASVSGALSNLTDWFSRNQSVAKILAVAAGVLGGVLLTVSAATKIVGAATKVYTAMQWLLNAALSANPIGLVIIALAALGAALVIAWEKSKTFRAIVTGTWEAVRHGAAVVIDFFRGNWPIIATLIAGPFAPIVAVATNAFGVRSALVGAFNAVLNAVRSVFWDVANFIHDRVNQVASFWEHLPGRIGSAILSGAGAIKNAVTGLFGRVIDWVKGVLGIGSPSKVFHEIGQNVVNGFVHGVGSMAGVLKHAVTHMVEQTVKDLGGFFGITVSHNPKDFAALAGNEKLAEVMAAQYGWKGAQWQALRKLWNQESGFSTTAINPRGGDPATAAYGIPQALPGRKMASAGADWRTNPYTQIKWGLEYIRSTYGNPLNAWNFDVAHGLKGYDQGGWLMPGLTMAMNATGQPERVLPPGGGETIVVPLVVDSKVLAQVMIDPLRRFAQIFQQQNGRTAFG